MIKINLIGQKFNRLKVLKRVDNKWECKCDCGNIVFINTYKLKSGHTKSCGCYKIDILKRNVITHGLSKTRIYKCYHDMKARCYRKSRNDYKWYGGKGIKVCKEWLSDFVIFYNWAINNNYRDNLTLDRKNTNGNYEPNNCQWITISEQQCKRSDCNFIEFNGNIYSMKQLSKTVNIPYNTLKAKYNKLNHNHTKFIEYINKKKLGGF